MLEELAAHPADAQKRAAIALTEERFLKSELHPPAALPGALLDGPKL